MKKILLFISACVVILCSVFFTSYAVEKGETDVYDVYNCPIKIEVLSDKSSYKTLGIAKFNVKIINTSDSTIDNISALVELDGMSPVGRKSEVSIENKTLEAGTSFDFSYKVTLDPNHPNLKASKRCFLKLKRFFFKKIDVEDNSQKVIEYNKNVKHVLFGDIETKNTIKIWYTDKSEFTNTELENIQSVDTSIEKFMLSDNYLDSDEIDKVKLINDKLYELSDDNLVINNSLKYVESTGKFNFKYSNGMDGFIEIKNTDNHSKTNMLSLADNINLSSKQRLETSFCDTSAKTTLYKPHLFWGFAWYDEPDSTSDIFYKEYTKLGLKTELENHPSIQDYKNNLRDKEIILIEHHGTVLDLFSKRIYTVSSGDRATKEKTKLYEYDIKNKLIYKEIGSDGKPVYLITPQFFEHYYKDNGLKDSVIILSVCNSFGRGDDDINYSMSSAFINSGASCVIGYHNSTNVNYAQFIAYYFINNMIKGDDAGSAFNFSVEKTGKNDHEFWANYYPDEKPLEIGAMGVAYPVFAGDTEKKLTAFKTSRLSDDEIYRQYIIDNLKVLDTTKYLPDKLSKFKVFSASINDFDLDGNKEMVIFSIKDEQPEIQGKKIIVAQLYKLINDNVVLCDTLKNINAYSAGNYESHTCAMTDGVHIDIENSSAGYGGSVISDEYISLIVKNNKFVVLNDFSTNEFPRYDRFEFVEKISGKIYSSADDFSQAALYAGHDLKHIHNDFFDGDYDFNNYEEFKGNHIFTLVDSVAMLGSEHYGFVHDNTELIKKSGIIIDSTD